MKITRRPDGRYCATIIKNGQRTFIYGASRREVIAKLVGSTSGQNTEETLEQFLSDWLERNRHGWSPKTYQSYEEMIRLYLMPHLGTIRLVDLTYTDVHKLIGILKKQQLSPRTVQYAVSVLSRALNWAVKWERVCRNVVKMTQPVRVPRHQVEPLTVEQAKQLLQAVEGHRMEPLYRMAISLGLRRGELLSLKWSDVDLERNTVTIRMSKTRSGERTLPIPAKLRTSLQEHRCAWGHQDYVFSSLVGTRILPRNLVRHFKGLLQSAGLPTTIRFHDLRHTCATFLIAEGVNLHVIKAILGHSRIGVTSDFYGHLLPGVQQAAVEGVDSLLE